jgi:hypothetical protein
MTRKTWTIVYRSKRGRKWMRVGPMHSEREARLMCLGFALAGWLSFIHDTAALDAIGMPE